MHISVPGYLPFVPVGLFLSNGWFCSVSSVQFSRSVRLLRPHESQHTRPPYPSQTPRVYPNSCPSSRWCHPAISSSVVPFSSCPQSPPASGSFPMSQLFSWGGQSIGVSASASVLPMNTQDWSPLGWTGWISLQSKGLSRVFSNTTAQKHQVFGAQLSSQSNSHIHTWSLLSGHQIGSTRSSTECRKEILEFLFLFAFGPFSKATVYFDSFKFMEKLQKWYEEPPYFLYCIH